MGPPKPQHPCAPRPTCRPGTDAGHRRPTLDHLEPHGEHRDGIARPFARTCVMRGTYPPFFIVPTRQRGNAVKDAPASVFFQRHGMLSIHPRLPGRLPRARGPAAARADHGLRCRRREGRNWCWRGASGGSLWPLSSVSMVTLERLNHVPTLERGNDPGPRWWLARRGFLIAGQGVRP